MRFGLVGLVLFVAGLTAAAGQAPVTTQEPSPLPSVSLPPPLARVLSDYENAWKAGNAAALALLFTEDGFVLTPGHPPVRGRAEIQKIYANGGGPLALRALAYASNGDVGFIIGGFGREPGAPDSGKFTLTLRLKNGRWLIASDMDNSNRRQ